jgi:hypothetical protein
VYIPHGRGSHSASFNKSVITLPFSEADCNSRLARINDVDASADDDAQKASTILLKHYLIKICCCLAYLTTRR